METPPNSKERELSDPRFTISTEISPNDMQIIFDYLHTESYWAKNISFERVVTAVSNSLCFGVYKKSQLAGFARVISDKATFAYLCDVFILVDFRGQGLSKWLLTTIVNHPELRGLRRWILVTRDAHDLYARFGFEKLSRPDQWMEILVPYE